MSSKEQYWNRLLALLLIVQVLLWMLRASLLLLLLLLLAIQEFLETWVGVITKTGMKENNREMKAERVKRQEKKGERNKKGQ